MRIIILSLLSTLALSSGMAQNKLPISMKQSEDFKSARRHLIMPPVEFKDKGILQVNERGTRSMNFQWFSPDLKLKKEKTIDIEDRLSERANAPLFVKMADRCYLFVRDVYRDEEREGVSALAFDVDKLDFERKAKMLFKSSGQVASAMNFSWTSFFGPRVSEPSKAGSFVDDDNQTFGPYRLALSQNKKVAAFTYRMRPEHRSDRANNDVIGVQVFDEEMNKLWGGEMRMPYKEAYMKNLNYIVGNDGKVYMLSMVGEGGYHLELLMYSKDHPDPEKIEVKLDDVDPMTARVFETEKGDLLLAGFYAKPHHHVTDGAFVLQVDRNQKTSSLRNGGLFEIPNELIFENATRREKRQLNRAEKRDEEGDLGVSNLVVRNVYLMDDGRIDLLAERYEVVTTIVHTSRTTYYRYDTYARDIYVISASPDGKSWTRKIPKYQHSRDARGDELSFSSLYTGDHLYVLYTDNKKNLHLSKTESPYTHEQGHGGYLACVTFDKDGNMNKDLLGEIDDFDTNFFIRRFVKGNRNNLIYTARRHRRNTLINIQVNENNSK